jgi:hypothetical protein
MDTKRLAAVEKEVKEVKDTLKILVTSVNKLSASVTKMNSGLYDDDENNHIGIITKYRLLKEEVESLKGEVTAIKQVNKDQDLAINTEKKVANKWLVWGKTLLRVIIEVVVVFAVMKGIIGADALLK